MKPRHGYGAEPRGLGWRKKFIFKVLERNTRVFFVITRVTLRKKITHCWGMSPNRQTHCTFHRQVEASADFFLSLYVCVWVGPSPLLVFRECFLSLTLGGRCHGRETSLAGSNLSVFDFSCFRWLFLFPQDSWKQVLSTGFFFLF